MRIFDTKVQHLKYKVLCEVARKAWDDKLLEEIDEIPEIIVPGPDPTMRCCVHKDRAIISERIKMAVGGNRKNPNIIEVAENACDECPAAGYEVTSTCRGCVAHRCEDVCKRGAISFDNNHVAHIDKSKCVECGLCSKVCPYSAITNRQRPCQNACKTKAIAINNDTNAAMIDNNKCIQCGACVYRCPFGAIMDKSFIINVIDIIKNSENGNKYPVYAMVAPSIASQFKYAKLGQIITSLHILGFTHVVEAAHGADLVAMQDAKELVEKGFLINSCCPAFAKYVRLNYPQLAEHISENLSPMATLAQLIKASNKDARVIFIGPCTAKKAEVELEKVKPLIDSVITFEELQALIDSRDIDVTSQEETELTDATYFGRIFARSGGLLEAVSQALIEMDSDFETKPIVCSGIEECKVALLKKSKGIADFNLIEGMACVGGCVGGAGCLTHSDKNKDDVDKFGKIAGDITLNDSISKLS